MKNNKCKFYQHTAQGFRCVLINPEEWKSRKDKLISYCMNEGKGCPVLRNYLRKTAKH